MDNSSAPSKSALKFPLGRVAATPGAMDALRRSGEGAGAYLNRHARGDWGDVPPEDATENEISVQQGLRILSAYRLTDNTKIWIITEADRTSTCVLLPEEY